jgi:uncharacterized membrane protein
MAPPLLDPRAMEDSSSTPDTSPSVLEQNVKAIGALRQRADERASTHQLFIERVTEALGRPRTIYVVVGATTLWVVFNVVAPRLGLPRLDPPPFFWLQGVIGLGALLMTTMVLTTQNRQVRHGEQRAHLDLQVNLLSEQKIAKVIGLLEELRRDLPSVIDRTDPVADAMTESVSPDNVITALEEVERALAEPKVR